MGCLCVCGRCITIGGWVCVCESACVWISQLEIGYYWPPTRIKSKPIERFASTSSDSRMAGGFGGKKSENSVDKKPRNKCLKFLINNWFMLTTILGVAVGFSIAFGIRAANPDEVTITWICTSNLKVCTHLWYFICLTEPGSSSVFEKPQKTVWMQWNQLWWVRLTTVTLQDMKTLLRFWGFYVKFFICFICFLSLAMPGDIYLRVLQLTILPLIASNILVGKCNSAAFFLSFSINHLSAENCTFHTLINHPVLPIKFYWHVHFHSLKAWISLLWDGAFH